MDWADKLTEAELANIKWSLGAPPAIGWWNASRCRRPNLWRWWDGARWSMAVSAVANPQQAARASNSKTMWDTTQVYWNSRWPVGARVARPS